MYSFLSAVLKSLHSSAHKAIIQMNPGMTCVCDVFKANANMQPLFEYFINMELSSFNQGASAQSHNSAEIPVVLICRR